MGNRWEEMREEEITAERREMFLCAQVRTEKLHRRRLMLRERLRAGIFVSYLCEVFAVDYHIKKLVCLI